MKWIRVPIRLGRLLRWVIWGLWHGRKSHIQALHQTPPEGAAQQRVQFWFAQALRAMNVSVSVQGQWSGAPRLLTCNHISWLDILVLGSVMPIVFLSKEEIRHWPVIRRLADAGGTLYIQRGSIGAARHSINEISQAFERQQSVLFFPEGTTSGGHKVTRFYPALFTAAIDRQVPVQPVALRYPHPEGVNPAVPFIDKTWLSTSLWRILGCAEIRAEVHLGEVIDSGQMECRELANQAHDFVAQVVEGGN